MNYSNEQVYINGPDCADFSCSNDFHVTSQVDSLQTQSTQSALNYQPPQQTFQTILAPTNLVHPNVFFYRPPNDSFHYYINCKEISYDTVIYLLNNLEERNNRSDGHEYIFYYRQYGGRVYEISCEIVSPFLIDNCLNKNFLGIELQQNAAQEHCLSFTFSQKENLKYHLKQYLSQYLLG
ncbi:hypothetical protein C1645_875504 [Glomus cerebriforme]|uniref:Uncharacterized protein n=1 Tax=Glomus cerebriforme TaxID=658196 RepID=A0A397SZ57_9GLOM|nr:hypothetical protein C1645_875504 [Glomus cerebriforme]